MTDFCGIQSGKDILLAKIDLLRILSDSFECVITEEVKKESTPKTTTDAKMISQLIKEGKIRVIKSEAEKELEYQFHLGRGEASTLKIATSKKMIIATDDKATINACKVFGLEFITSIDFVLRAYEKGKINKEETKEKIRKLDEYGRYDTRIIKLALEKIGDKNE